MRTAVERGRRDDVLARPHDRRDREMHRGLSAGGGDRPDAAFERGHPFFEHRGCGIGDARVHMAGPFRVEQRRGVVGITEDVGRRLVDRGRAGAGRRIGLLARVQAQCVELDVSGSAHGWPRRKRAGAGRPAVQFTGRMSRYARGPGVSSAPSRPADCTTVRYEVIGKINRTVRIDVPGSIEVWQHGRGVNS